MGKRNEPINSLSLLLRHRLKIIKEQEKRCFLLDTFRISVLKQRLLGEALGFCGIHYHLSPITYHQNIFYNGEFDPGSGWTIATGLTHASRGETALSACTFWTSTGARVSNAYPTFPWLRDNLPKGRLIPYSLHWRHQMWSKDLSVMDGDASD